MQSSLYHGPVGGLSLWLHSPVSVGEMLRVRVLSVQARGLAGHSHYHNVRHRKEAVDKARNAALTKLAREVRTALRMGGGGGDPRANARLASALQNARRAGMPKDRLNRMLDSARNSPSSDKTALFEGVLPAGVGILIRTSAERKKALAGELRALLTRADGEMGRAAWMFEDRVAVVVRTQDQYPADDVACCAIEEGAVDVVENEDGAFELLCETEKAMHLKGKLIERLPLLKGELVYTTREFRPRSLVSVSEGSIPKMQKLLNKLDEHPDVIEVVHNAEIVEED